MSVYNVYSLDHDGRNVETQAITAWSDEEAIWKARTIKGLRQCEVWRGYKLVGRVTNFSEDRASA